MAIRRRLFVLVGLTAVLVVAAVLYRNWAPGGAARAPQPQGEGAAQAARAPAPVVTAPATVEDFPIRRRTIGTLESPAIVTIRSRVDSQVLEQHVRDGQLVKKGDLLFTLDDRELRAALARDEAQLAKDQAALSRSELDLRRAQELIERNAAPQTQLETAIAENKGAIATVQADQAQIQADQLRLEYTRIVAPMDGRIGTVRVAPGNLVSAGEATGLTSLTQMQPLRVTFTLPERDLSALRAARERTPPETVRVYTPNTAELLAEGTLDFVDTSVDVASGTIVARASFANEKLELWPGQYVDVEITLSVRPRTVLIPTVAVQSGQRGPFVFVAGADQTAKMRQVELIASEGDRTAIASGVAAGERVLVEGQFRVVDGNRIVEAPPKPAAASDAASAAGTPVAGSAAAQ